MHSSRFKYLTAAAFLFICGLLFSSPQPAAGAEIRGGMLHFKVMSYNMLKCRSRETRKFAPRAISAPIASIKPDLLGIQERDSKCDSAVKSASQLPYQEYLISGKGLTTSGKSYWITKTNGIASRWPFKSRSIEITGTYKHQKSFLNHALVDMEGIPVSFYVTHMTNVGYSSWKGAINEFLGRTPRVNQMKQIVEVLKKDPHRYKILVGDFNSVPMAAPWRILSDYMEDAFSLIHLTGTRRTKYPNLIRIDHIFTTEDVQVEEAWVAEMGVSDHFPVAARLAIPIPAAESDKQKVMRAQKSLKRLGFLTREPDGLMTAPTREAIMEYQARLGLPVDGCLLPETLQALGAGTK
jgi:endonuclease/exonuclease/phosphatase family metal-dependent hydrolase